MEKKYNVPIIAISVFVIAILINFDTNFIVPVYAITFEKVATDIELPIIESWMHADSNTLWVITGNGAGLVYLYDVNPTTGIVRLQYNYSFFDAALDAQDLWCGATYCYISFGDSSSSSAKNDSIGKLIRFGTGTDAIDKGEILYPIYNNTDGGIYQITGKDSLTGGFGGVSIYSDACVSVDNLAECTNGLKIIDGITMGSPFESAEYFNNAGMIGSDIEWSGISGVNNNHLMIAVASMSGDPDALRFWLFNLANLSLICETVSSSNIGLQVGNDVTFVTPDYSGATKKWYLGREVGDSAEIVGTACTDIGTLTSAQTGLSITEGIRDMVILPDQSIALAQEGGANARISSMPYDTTTGTIGTNTEILFTFPSTSQILAHGKFTYQIIGETDGEIIIDGSELWIPYSGSDQDILHIDIDGEVSGAGETVCIEVAEGGQQVCYEDTDGNGIPNFPNGSFDTLRPPTQNVTTIGASLTCAIGFNDAACENDNPKENGVGLLLLIILVLVSYSFLVSIHIGAVKVLNKQNVAVMDYLNINPVLLLVMLIIDVGAAFYMQWIPDVIFYTVVVVMGGLAAWGYFSAVKGRGSSA